MTWTAMSTIFNLLPKITNRWALDFLCMIWKFLITFRHSIYFSCTFLFFLYQSGMLDEFTSMSSGSDKAQQEARHLKEGNGIPNTWKHGRHRYHTNRAKAMNFVMWATMTIGVIVNMWPGRNVWPGRGAGPHMNGPRWAQPGSRLRPDLPQCPTWSPDSDVSFRTWVSQVHSWLLQTNARMRTSSQAAAVQRAVRGTAHDFAMSIPTDAIANGAILDGIATDPVTYVLIQIVGRYVELRGNHALHHDPSLYSFRRGHQETTMDMISRCTVERLVAEQNGHGTQNYDLLSTILVRAIGFMMPDQLNALQHSGGQIPRNELEYHGVVQRIIAISSPTATGNAVPTPPPDHDHGYVILEVPQAHGYATADAVSSS